LCEYITTVGSYTAICWLLSGAYEMVYDYVVPRPRVWQHCHTTVCSVWSVQCAPIRL